MPLQRDIAKHLDLSERKVRDILVNLDMDHRTSSMDEIRLAYIRDLREKAGGRGGDDQGALTRARTRQAIADADMKNLQYHRELKTLVAIDEVEPVLKNWAKNARSEVQYAIEKMIAGIQSRHNIEVEQDVIDDAINPAFRAIGRYPQKSSFDDDAGWRDLDT